MNDQEKNYIWVDGKFVNYNDATTHVMTHALHYATSVYEGIRVYNKIPFKLKEHIDRLYNSAEIINISIKHKKDEMLDAVNKLIELNQVTNGYIRPLVYQGEGSMKIGAITDSKVMIYAYNTYSYYNNANKGLCLEVSNWRKPSPNAYPHNCKGAGGYMVLSLAKSNAIKRGYDDCLMLDHNDHVAECASSNIFFSDNLALYTPMTHSALAGITRATIIDIAKKLGINVYEANIKTSDLSKYSECFITGTAAEMQQVDSITDENSAKYTFASDKMIKALRKEYKALVGVDH